MQNQLTGILKETGSKRLKLENGMKRDKRVGEYDQKNLHETAANGV